MSPFWCCRMRVICIVSGRWARRRIGGPICGVWWGGGILGYYICILFCECAFWWGGGLEKLVGRRIDEGLE